MIPPTGKLGDHDPPWRTYDIPNHAWNICRPTCRVKTPKCDSLRDVTQTQQHPRNSNWLVSKPTQFQQSPIILMAALMSLTGQLEGIWKSRLKLNGDDWVFLGFFLHLADVCTFGTSIQRARRSRNSVIACSRRYKSRLLVSGLQNYNGNYRRKEAHSNPHALFKTHQAEFWVLTRTQKSSSS